MCLQIHQLILEVSDVTKSLKENISNKAFHVTHTQAHKNSKVSEWIWVKHFYFIFLVNSEPLFPVAALQSALEWRNRGGLRSSLECWLEWLCNSSPTVAERHDSGREQMQSWCYDTRQSHNTGSVLCEDSPISRGPKVREEGSTWGQKHWFTSIWPDLLHNLTFIKQFAWNHSSI